MSSRPKVRIYVTSWCGFCRAAKRLLDERQVPYEEIDLTGDDAARAEAAARHDWPTVPIVLAGDELIGGYTELAALDQSRGLDHLR
jgi:glutaredoxin 3